MWREPSCSSWIRRRDSSPASRCLSAAGRQWAVSSTDNWSASEVVLGGSDCKLNQRRGQFSGHGFARARMDPAQVGAAAGSQKHGQESEMLLGQVSVLPVALDDSVASLKVNRIAPNEIQ